MSEGTYEPSLTVALLAYLSSVPHHLLPFSFFHSAADVARRQRRRGAAAAAAASAGNAAKRRCQGYHEFFVQTVPVAPNRFRPVNNVGDMVRCCIVV